MSEYERLQRKRTKGWRMPENAVYVGRPSKWGNPWEVDGEWVFGPAPAFDSWNFDSPERARQFAVDQYREGLRASAVAGLRGKDLVCWCPLDVTCHADVLLEAANAEDV